MDKIGCMTAECGKPARWRGLCQNCYQRLRKRVLVGELTWADAERAGLCLPDRSAANRRRYTRDSYRTVNPPRPAS